MICSKCHQELSISKLFKIVKTEQLKRIFESETRFQMGPQAWRGQGQGQAGAGARAAPRLSQGTERPGRASRGPRTGQESLSGLGIWSAFQTDTGPVQTLTHAPPGGVAPTAHVPPRPRLSLTPPRGSLWTVRTHTCLPGAGPHGGRAAGPPVCPARPETGTGSRLQRRAGPSDGSAHSRPSLRTRRPELRRRPEQRCQRPRGARPDREGRGSPQCPQQPASCLVHVEGSTGLRPPSRGQRAALCEGE